MTTQKQQGKRLFGFIEDMQIRQSRNGAEYVRATLVAKRRDGEVSFKTKLIMFTPKKNGAKQPIVALKALGGNGANVEVFGYMEDVDNNGKFTVQMLRVVDLKENTRNADKAAEKAAADDAAKETTTVEKDVEVPF